MSLEEDEECPWFCHCGGYGQQAIYLVGDDLVGQSGAGREELVVYVRIGLCGVCGKVGLEFDGQAVEEG